VRCQDSSAQPSGGAAWRLNFGACVTGRTAPRMRWLTALAGRRRRSAVTELPQGGLKPMEVRRLLDLYGVEGQRLEELLALAREATYKGWWEEYADAMPEDYVSIIGLGAEAPASSSLDRDPPLQLSVVLDQAVLLRRVGSNSVMRDQLTYLAVVAQLPNVSLRIKQLDESFPAVANSFDLLAFGRVAGATMPDVVWTDHLTTARYFEGEADACSMLRALDTIDWIRREAWS
jgi:Domain of unknown function (DUF5753)